MNSSCDTVRTYSAHDRSVRLAALLSREHHALAEFLVALAEFDRERAWVELGHASLFSYLRRELRLSTGAAFYRQTAARLIQQHPEVIEPLRDGRLCLTTVVEVSRVVTRENLADALPRFFGTSKQEAKEVAAELSPEAVPSRTVVTPLAVVSPPPPALELPVSSRAPGPSLGATAFRLDETPAKPSCTEPAPRPSTVAPTVVEPKTAELSRMHLTVSRRLLEKLTAARDALSHSHPGASEDEIAARRDFGDGWMDRFTGTVTPPRLRAPAPALPSPP